MERHIAFAKIKLHNPSAQLNRNTTNEQSNQKQQQLAEKDGNNKENKREHKTRKQSPEKSAVGQNKTQAEDSKTEQNKVAKPGTKQGATSAATGDPLTSIAVVDPENDQSRPNSSGEGPKEIPPAVEEFFVVNLDCSFVLLLEHLKSKLLTDQGAICDLELIDESGQIMNIADFSPKERGYNLLKENCTYYPVIIKKNSDGSLSNFDIYGKEKFSLEIITKLTTQIKKCVNKLSKKKAADNADAAESLEAAAAMSSTGKVRKKKTEKGATESSG